MALSLARQAFIGILAEGQGAVGGTILPPPDGVWGMPPEVLHSLPGYGPDVASNRTEARGIMKRLGYAPDKRLAVKVSTRDVPSYRDTAVIAISQLRRSTSTANSRLSTPRIGFRGSSARTTRSGSRSPRVASTSRTRNSTKPMSAAPTAITPAIAMTRSTGNQWKRPQRGAANWSGRSSADWRKTLPGRYCCIRGLPPACSRSSGSDDDDQQPLSTVG